MKFMIHVGIGFVGCQHDLDMEIPDQELRGMTRDEIQERVHEDAKEMANERLEYWVRLVDENNKEVDLPEGKEVPIPGPGEGEDES